jgi:hypothetical protein
VYDDLNMYEYDSEVSHESIARNTPSQSIVPARMGVREGAVLERRTICDHSS